MARNYKKEYENYHAQPEQKKRRAARNAARAVMQESGAVRKGDGKDVDHKNGNPTDGRKANLRAIPKSANRSFARTASAKKRNPRD